MSRPGTSAVTVKVDIESDLAELDPIGVPAAVAVRDGMSVTDRGRGQDRRT
jgi:hypothetical protein